LSLPVVHSHEGECTCHPVLKLADAGSESTQKSDLPGKKFFGIR
jgi:hypothetical protein